MGIDGTLYISGVVSGTVGWGCVCVKIKLSSFMIAYKKKQNMKSDDDDKKKT